MEVGYKFYGSVRSECPPTRVQGQCTNFILYDYSRFSYSGLRFIDFLLPGSPKLNPKINPEHDISSNFPIGEHTYMPIRKYHQPIEIVFVKNYICQVQVLCRHSSEVIKSKVLEIYLRLHLKKVANRLPCPDYAENRLAFVHIIPDAPKTNASSRKIAWMHPVINSLAAGSIMIWKTGDIKKHQLFLGKLANNFVIMRKGRIWCFFAG
ncbi:hypothetical protein DFH27DRAFT_336929 [Peziza echinospora]|nr:hypothetical protein DFH27DRAFT_336929 [Peziza echinospora]